MATPRGLATVDLNTKKTAETTNSGKGEPAQPVSTGGCVFAAWAQKANNYAKVCSVDSSDMTFDTLTNINATSELIFRTNHRLVILNDVVNGNVWNPQESTKVIKIQWNKVETKQSKQQEQNNDSANNQHNFSKTCSSQSGQIKAEDDSFGARTGSQQILDVLRNDEQTDCSVLRITSVSAPDGANISVSPVYDGRYLQLDASAASEGSVSFSYEISDGRGQTSNANVSLTLVGGDDNAPQQTDTPPEIDVEQGATYTTNALGSFSDPDGDPLTLVSATPQNTDQVTVSTRADGQLVFNAGSMSSGRAGIEVTVSDGQQTGTGMVYFSVKPANTLAAVIDPAVKQTTPDTRTTIALKQYVHGTSAEPAQLTAVETPSGASTTMNATDMSFTFSASNPGTYYVPYTITQGSIPSTGLARIEVQAVTGDSAKPIAANDVALLGADNTAIVEPLSNDVDPMGGVLSVTSVTADAASGIKTGVVSNKRVYITARQVPTEPVQIKYSVANAAGTSTGVIVLQPPALTTSNSVPKADNITTQVRTDGIVSIDVLDHVTYSDGTSDEVYGFDIPVAAVDADFQLAILGTKGTWYDHTVSVSDAEPAAEDAAAAAVEVPADGSYTCAVTLEGGSGRATVESPAALTVADGIMTATIVWSSPNYDYMLVDGEKYLPVNTDGNSTFEIPVAALDTALAVTAVMVPLYSSITSTSRMLTMRFRVFVFFILSFLLQYHFENLSMHFVLPDLNTVNHRSKVVFGYRTE